MGIATDRERAVSTMVGPQHAEHGASAEQEAKKRVPGYPQDEMMMMMTMDESVARPENNGLAPGWSSMLQGMMSLIRVLPADKYEKLMADIKAGRVEKTQPQQEHKHHEE
jgi:hypothetical protein